MNGRLVSIQWLPFMSTRTMSNREAPLSILKNFRVQAQDRIPGKNSDSEKGERQVKPFVDENR